MDSSAVFSHQTTGATGWQGPIDSVGTERFDMQLMRSLEDLAGVEHHASFIMTRGETRLLTADAGIQSHCELAAAARSAAQTAWERPHRSDERGGGAVVFRIKPAIPCDGVFVCDERDGVSYGLALMRTLHRGRFTETELDCLRSVAGTWLSLISKHQRLLAAKRQIDAGSALLGSVQEIEEKLRQMMPSLTPREAQVCARLLRGMSTPGIALDLSVREDSVATYRKRAYRRLYIGTQFELVQLFVTACVTADLHQ
ncbi:helix-turn-helix transcriptional regulator [Hydrogenophaga sp.]|uniref:helix-turn-helix transcriptional regulator n=1 Tax=Hydrogenophaga sp. TaxID=1904254 RepID=UPI00271946B3|nr:helix-turn-helix transcriptional regulator [Hydrogenophaga sp.]MDO9435939.1 helix-turn-helix transcriptional regulator [Hydrogenophaga sp.]